eukprot:TRINITY_DN6055_c0_g2_i1.p2 TRINITY_DN6055_c0_g2~~TRINITY_DN6055_c0_g2_i1.p2  ORF type:complete len:175 (-),score=26.89 TRINITY_DN6055_c0_g2_i1:73-597(-)
MASGTRGDVALDFLLGSRLFDAVPATTFDGLFPLRYRGSASVTNLYHLYQRKRRRIHTQVRRNLRAHFGLPSCALTIPRNITTQPTTATTVATTPASAEGREASLLADLQALEHETATLQGRLVTLLAPPPTPLSLLNPSTVAGDSATLANTMAALQHLQALLMEPTNGAQGSH